MSNQKSMISLPGAVESQGREITAGHHPPHGGEGLSDRINNNPEKGADVTG